ncbi:SspB family protein [Thermaurantiacus tibetensis]|uniref:SspB family protein n=1 Tax=Thermaurantiacus tibetensis TaxID=2759035 RepID=UPI00188FEA32|nr:ClpXP protease specificity-enhancing factor SspB [Thermaurantiacus tibetensis]
MSDPDEPSDPPDSLIPYDEIVQDCLRGVIRRVLADVAAAGGLPGGHHFYINFKTRYPGVEMPAYLVERYPDDMTIVIQHRFWDLKAEETHFEIGLTFNQVPARLKIPYAAITGFLDRAVNFALQFAVTMPDGPSPAPEDPAPAPEGETAGSNVVSLDFTRRKS